MHHFFKKNIFILLGFLLSYSSCVFSHEFEDRILASINGEPITQSQLETQIKFLSQHMPAESLSSANFKKEVLQRMINRKLEVQIAKAKGLSVDAIQIENAMKKIAEKENMSLMQFEEKIKKSGFSIENFKKQLESELLVNELQEKEIASHIHITEEEVKDYSQQEKYTFDNTYAYEDSALENELKEDQIKEVIFKHKFEEALEKWLSEQHKNAYIKIYDPKLVSS